VGSSRDSFGVVPAIRQSSGDATESSKSPGSQDGTAANRQTNNDEVEADDNNNSIKLADVIEKFQSVLVKEVSKLNEDKDFELNLLDVMKNLQAHTGCEFQSKIYMLDDESNPTLIKDKENTDNALLILPSGALAVFYPSQDDLASQLKGVVTDLMEKNIKETQQTKDKKEEKLLEPSLNVPIFLHDYVKQMLPRFVKNACMVAFQMTEGESYKIAPLEGAKEEDGHVFDSIIPVDFASTGVLEKNKRYSEGIQQFLEMKHQLSISDVTVTTNFLSNFTFYTRFKEIHGLTGKLRQ
jgi:hypothetical protein